MKHNSNKVSFFMSFLFVIIFFTSCTVKNKDGPPKPPKGYWNMTTLKIAYALGTIDQVEMKFPVPDNLIEYKDVVYKTIDSTDLHLDIYHSKNLTKKVPLLLFIHGGGLSKGDKSDYLVYTCAFAQKGYVTASVQYRFVDKVKFPAQLFELKAALRWLKENADKYHIDPNKIALIGGSAGGHLAMMTGYTSDIKKFNEENDSLISYKVQAIVDLYGPVDFTTKWAREHRISVNMFGKTYREDPKIFELSSPINYISKDDPPTLIFQGTIDDLVPVSQSDTLENRLIKAGVPVEYHRLKGWPHTMDIEVGVNAYCQHYMERFFEKYIPKN
jgi:acetyl esterase/lipase